MVVAGIPPTHQPTHLATETRPVRGHIYEFLIVFPPPVVLILIVLCPSRSRSSTQSQRRGPTARSSSASPYPFHPDRLDPASPPNSAETYDNSVNWYYSSYNNNNNNNSKKPNPRAGPRHQRTSGERLSSGAGTVGSWSWLSVILPTVSLLLSLHR